jgi:hypothetical protein
MPCDAVNYEDELMNPLALFRKVALLLVIALCGAVVAQAAPPAPAAQTQIFLPLVAKAGAPNPDPNPDPEPDPNPGGPTSDELINAAVDAGTLDQEMGLLYRVFAAFGDGRLPAAYRGARPATISYAFDDAARVFARLKPETQAALRDFAVPPSAEGSWEEQQGVAARAAVDPNRWATTCQTSPNIKVWYHPYYEGDAQKAREICEVVDATIWPKLVGLMGRAPLPDDTLPHTGGDARFDIYLVDASSAVAAQNNKSQATPAHMLVNRHGHTRSQLAQLLMQAILMGYNANPNEYVWLRRATQVWAADYVFSTDNAEHSAAPAYLNATATPLNNLSTSDGLFVPISVDGPEFADGAYLWPFFLARHVSDPQIVRTLWDRSGEADSLAMTNDVLPGGFKQQWPNFAELNWNREPVDLYKGDVLRVGATPALSTEVRLDGAPAMHFDMPAKVPYLAAEYYHFTFPDDSVRSVLFSNSLSHLYGDDTKFAEVQLIYRTADDAWSLVTLGDQQYAPFCRDLAAEHITELTVIVSNSDWQGKKTLAPLKPLGLEVTNVPCRGWSFEASATITTTAQNYLETTTTTAKGTFELLRDDAGKSRFGYHFEMYQPVGTANWTYSYSFGECSVAAKQGTYPLADLRPDPTPGADLHIETYNLPYDSVGASGVRRYSSLGVAPVHARPKVADSCGHTHQVNPMWLRTFGAPFDKSVSGDGLTIKDTFTDRRESGGFTIVSTWTWEMKPLPPE